MKKLLFLLPLLFFITGYGHKVTCTAKITEDGKQYEAKITANLKNNKVDSGKMELVFDSKEEGEQYCNLIKAFMSLASEEEKVDIKCDGKKMTIDSLDFDSGDESDTVIGKTKDEFISKMKEQYPDVVCK